MDKKPIDKIPLNPKDKMPIKPIDKAAIDKAAQEHRMTFTVIFWLRKSIPNLSEEFRCCPVISTK